MNHLTLILLITASGIDSAVTVLAAAKGNHTQLINILHTASTALRAYVNGQTISTGNN